jgi:hypothetical protein
MEENNFRNFLREKGTDKALIELYITRLHDYSRYLEQKDKTLKIINPDELISYTEYLVSIDKDLVLEFLRAIINYANYGKEYDLIKEVIDISESYNAMDTLYSRIAEIHGQKIRDDIFHELTIPPLGVNPEKKPQFTKKIMARVKEVLGEENIIKLLSPCLHGRPPEDIPGDKKRLKELGIDKFLKSKHKDLINRLQKHRDEGTLEFAQYIDEEVIDFIKKDQMFGFGIREGNTIYVKKIPYQTKNFLNAQENNLKRFFICYCPWVRGAMKENAVDESLRHFCHCSAGWYKLYWDQILDYPIKAEPVSTALEGSFECKIALLIPEKILKPYIRN